MPDRCRRRHVLAVFVCLLSIGCTRRELVPIAPAGAGAHGYVRITHRDGTLTTLLRPAITGDSISGMSIHTVCHPSFDRTRTVCAQVETALTVALGEIELAEAPMGLGPKSCATGWGPDLAASSARQVEAQAHDTTGIWSTLYGECLRISGVVPVGGVAMPGSAIEGRLTGSVADTLVFQLDDETARVVAPRTVTVEQWRRGGSTKGWIGGGALLGLLAGGLAAYALNSEPERSERDCFANPVCVLDDFGTIADKARAVMLGIVVGAPVGALVGHLIGRGRAEGGWRRVGSAIITAVPSRHRGFSLGLSISH